MGPREYFFAHRSLFTAFPANAVSRWTHPMKPILIKRLTAQHTINKKISVRGAPRPTTRYPPPPASTCIALAMEVRQPPNPNHIRYSQRWIPLLPCPRTGGPTIQRPTVDKQNCLLLCCNALAPTSSIQRSDLHLNLTSAV